MSAMQYENDIKPKLHRFYGQITEYGDVTLLARRRVLSTGELRRRGVLQTTTDDSEHH